MCPGYEMVRTGLSPASDHRVKWRYLLYAGGSWGFAVGSYGKTGRMMCVRREGRCVDVRLWCSRIRPVPKWWYHGFRDGLLSSVGFSPPLLLYLESEGRKIIFMIGYILKSIDYIDLYGVDVFPDAPDISGTGGIGPSYIWRSLRSIRPLVQLRTASILRKSPDFIPSILSAAFSRRVKPSSGTFPAKNPVSLTSM